MRKSLIGIIFGVVLALQAQIAPGQDIPRYTPQRPTISPYLNLLRNDNGILPNYYSLVRPQLSQQSFDNRILSTSRSQARAVRRLSELSELATAGQTGTASTFGNISHFQNRSHFYPARQRSLRRR